MSTSPQSEPGAYRCWSDRPSSLSLLFLFFFISCAPTLSQRYPVTLPDFRSIVEGHLRDHRAILTDRRIFTFQIRYGIHTVNGEGVFLYKRPGHARIDLYVGASELVFQYFRNPERSTIVLPYEGRKIEGRAGAVVLTGIAGLEGMTIRENELVTMMLGMDEEIGDPDGRIEARSGEDGYLLCDETGEEVSCVHLDRQTYSLTRYEAFSGGEKIRDIRFYAFREIDGIPRPQSVDFTDGVASIRIRVTFRDEAINSELDPGLFEPLSG